MKKIIVLSALILSGVTALFGKEVLTPVKWTLGEVTFAGEYAKGRPGMPGIIIFHQWMGLSAHEKDVAERLHKLGYTVLAADVYGENNRPQNTDQAKTLAMGFYQDRQKLRDYANAAVTKFKSLSGLPGSQIFAIGYCFGGTTVLELGRSGTQLKGLVSFHGGLSNPTPADDANIQGKVLILHGANDQAVPLSDLTALMESLKSNHKDWSVHIFADAVHGFTHRFNPQVYNAQADKRSWEIFLDFLKE